MITIKIPGPLRKLTGSKSVVGVEGKTVKEAITNLISIYPELEERIKDRDGRIREFLNIYVNNEDIRFLRDLETELKDGDEIVIIPAIAGGGGLNKRRVTLYFPPERIKEPIVYEIGHKFQLITNIRAAHVTEDMGWVTLEIEGSEEEYLKACSYLKEKGIQIEAVQGDVVV